MSALSPMHSLTTDHDKGSWRVRCIGRGGVADLSGRRAKQAMEMTECGKGGQAGFMAFHAFHTLSFPWPVLDTPIPKKQPPRMHVFGTTCPRCRLRHVAGVSLSASALAIYH
jgi:hypothetical protein